MTSQLNPEAAVFRPVLPKKIIMIDEAIITASPDIKFEEASPLNVEYSSSPKQVDYFMRDNFSTIPNKIKELSTHAVCSAPEFSLKPQDHMDHIPIAIDKFLGVQSNPREVSQELAQTALMESILISIEDDAIVDNNNKTNSVFGEIKECEVSEMPEMITLIINQADSFVDKQIKSDIILPKDEPTKGQKKRPKSSRNKHKRRYKKFEPIAIDNSGFITELRRTPPIDLTFKPIQTFSDDNPFGALQSSAIPTPNSTPMDDYYNLADLYKTPPQSPQREEASSKLEMSLNIVTNTPPSFILRRSPVDDQVVPFEELESPNEPPPFVHPPNANRKIASTELPKSPELEDKSEVLSAQSLKISLPSSEDEKNNTVGTKHDSIVQTPITKKKNKKISFSEKKPMNKTNTELNSDEKFFRPEYTIRQSKKESNFKNKQDSANVKTDLVAIKLDSPKPTVDDKDVPETGILKASSANLNTCLSTNSKSFDVEIASDSKPKGIENMQNILGEDSSIDMQETSFTNKNNNESKQPTEQLSKKKAQEVKEQLPEKLSQELTEHETEQSPEKLKKQAKKQLPEQILKKVTEQLTEQLPGQPTEQVKEQLPEKLTEQVTEQLPENVTDKVTEQVTEQLPEKLTDQVTEQLPEKLTDQVTEQLSENLTEHAKEQLPEKLTEQQTEQLMVQLPEKPTEQITEQLMEHLQQKLPEQVTEHLVEKVSDQLNENRTVSFPTQILENNESSNINDAKEENQELKNLIHCNGEGEMTLQLEDQVSTSPTTPEEIRSLVQGFEVIDRNELIQDDYTPDKIFGTDYRTENAIFQDGDKIINVRVTVKNSSENSELSDEINTTGLNWLPLDDTHFADKPQTISTESTDCKEIEKEETQIVVDDVTLELGEHLQSQNPSPITENKESVSEELEPLPKESDCQESVQSSVALETKCEGETIGTTQEDSNEASDSEMTEVALTAEDPAPTLHDPKDCQTQNDILEDEISKITPEATNGESELTSGEEEPLELKTAADEFVSIPSDLNAQALEPPNLDELASAKKPATKDTTSATRPSGVKSVASASGKTSAVKPAAGTTTPKSAATGSAAKTAAPSKPTVVASKSTTPSKPAASSTPAKSASGTTASKLATTGVAASKSAPSNAASTKPTTSGTASKPAASTKPAGTSVAASKASSSTAPKSTSSATSKPSTTTTATSAKPAPGATSKPATSSSAPAKPTASTTPVKKPVSAALKSSASKTATPSPAKPTVSSTTSKPVLKELPVGEASALKSLSKPSSPLSNPSSPTSPKSPMTKSIASLPSPTTPKSPVTKSVASLPSPTTPKSPVTKSIPAPLKLSTATDAKSLVKKIDAPKSSATTKAASPAKPVSGTKAVTTASKPQAATPSKTTAAKPASAATATKPASATTAVKPASATTAAKPASATTAAKPASATTTVKPASATTAAKPASATTAAKPASATTAAKKPVGASDENSKVTSTAKKPTTTTGVKPAEKSSKEPSGAKIVSGKATPVKSSSVKTESKQTTKNGEKIIPSKKTEEGKKQEKSVQELKVTTTNEINQPIIQV